MREIDKSKPITFKKRIRKWFSIKTPIYNNWWIYPLIVLVFFIFAFLIPIIINESYKANDGYLTLWEASDVLSFYAVILSGLITITALIITIYFSKKDTEKQLRYYMSQTRAPFFVIEGIVQLGSAQEFQKKEDGTWTKGYKISDSGNLNEKEAGIIGITLKNIGEGVALTPFYQIDMFASTIVSEHIVSKDTSIRLSYDLQKNLNDKWINHFFDSERNKSGSIEFYTYIRVSYQNIMGIWLHQQIKIAIKLELPSKIVTLVFNEASPQQIEI